MNFRIIFTFFVLGVALVGCSLDGDSNQTPQVALADYPRLQSGDSLNVMTTDEYNVFSLDTVQVGDTVSFVLYMLSYSNDLTGFYLTQSADSSAVIILPETTSMDSVFLSHSDYAKGQFFMQTGFNSMYFPFKYVAKKVNKETTIGFRVVSDAVFENTLTGSNSSSFELITPIKDSIQ